MIHGTAARSAVVALLTIALAGCTGGADRSLLDVMLLRKPEPPSYREPPQTAEEPLKSKVKWDGYPDPSYVPNPPRLPELSVEEREQTGRDLAEMGATRMEQRLMTCEAEDPADCVR